MKNRVFVLILCLLMCSIFIFSCDDSSKNKPPVSPEKMTDILTDLHLADAHSQGLGTIGGNVYTKNKDSLAVFYNSILKHHNLSYDELKKNLDWYHHHPQILDSVYVMVVQKIEQYQMADSAKKQ